jgi:hypothetical protein
VSASGFRPVSQVMVCYHRDPHIIIDMTTEATEWTSADWEYLPTPHSIRLLRVKLTDEVPVGLDITLRAVDLDDDPSYNCLSYTWGNPLMNDTNHYADHRVLCNNKRTYIGYNLFEALRTLTELDAKHTADIWVDKLSINQMNVEERTSQVRMMGRIYRGAQNVLAWLGPADEDTAIAVQVIETLSRANIDNDKTHVNGNPQSHQRQKASSLLNETTYTNFEIPFIKLDHWRSYVNLLSRSYFSRVSAPHSHESQTLGNISAWVRRSPGPAGQLSCFFHAG